jgi:ribose/xylose/arabinose/galactoside ABC-type transport system permease subunit
MTTADLAPSLQQRLRSVIADPAERNKFLGRSAIYFILILLILISALASDVFLLPRNLINVTRQASILGIVAIGQTFVILTGGIDLSVAAVMALMSILSADLMAGQDARVLPIALLCLSIASLIGLVNGLLVTRLKIPSFIATLGMVLIVQGMRFLYSGGTPKGSIPDALRFFGREFLVGVPISVWICLLILVLCAVILSRTTFGRAIYSTGGNDRTAYLSGIRIDRVRILAYVLCSFWAGVAGLLLTGYIGIADNWLGQGYDLNSIAAVVIGGTMMSGGKGGVWGSVAGALMMAILLNMVVLLGLPVEAQRILKGLVIIAAVALYARLSGSRD